MPFIWPHLALMPDAHQGKGATVGSVIPTLGAIVPSAVSVDIGCGMIATRTELTRDDVDGKPLAVLRTAIEDAIPPSAGKYNDAVCDEGTVKRIVELEAREGADSAEAIAPNWRLQLCKRRPMVIPGAFAALESNLSLKKGRTLPLTPVPDPDLLTAIRERWGGSLSEFNKELRRTAWNWQASAGHG